MRVRSVADKGLKTLKRIQIADKTIEALGIKIKQLEEIIVEWCKNASTGGQPSTTDKWSTNDLNIPSRVSSAPVPNRDRPVKSINASVRSCQLTKR